tara:strand:- start:497 stop:2320 length:1824 start_codon:yes stop_codon:yes gene_type:complete
MPALVTTEFRIHNAKQFREMFSEAAQYGGATASAALSTNMYLFIGKSAAWSGSFNDGTTTYQVSDTAQPDPNKTNAPSSDTTANTSYSHWKDMIAAKKVASSDVSHVIARNNWTSGRYYSMYDDTIKFSSLTASQASQNVNSGTADTTATLYPMYVMNSTFKVYKCLYNNKTESGRPRPSTVEPTHTTTSAAAPAAQSDGYVWKYMYTISAAESLKFVTSSYIPVKQIRDANAYGQGGTAGGMAVGGAKDDSSDQVLVERNAIDGALDIFVISNDGANYHFENNKAIASGTGTTLVVSATSLTTANAYANSSVYFTYGGTSYVRKVASSTYNSGTSQSTLTLSATLGVTLSGTMPTCNVGPWPRIDGDGHGQELVLTANTTGGAAAGSVGGVTVVNSGNSFTTATMTVSSQPGASSPSGAIITPIIPPKGGHGFDAVSELGGYFAMINTKLTQSESGAFTTSNDFRKIGLLKDPNTNGGFTRYTSDTADQAKVITYSSANEAVTGDITITQAASGATAYVVDVNTTASTMRVIDVTNGSSATNGYDGKPGSFQTGSAATSGTLSFTVGAVANGAMSIGSGEMLYIENRAPVARAADQTEDIKLIIEF